MSRNLDQVDLSVDPFTRTVFLYRQIICCTNYAELSLLPSGQNRVRANCNMCTQNALPPRPTVSGDYLSARKGKTSVIKT
jgi:hypothetical protein